MNKSLQNVPLENLEAHIYTVNQGLFERIMDFFQRYGRLSTLEINKIEKFLLNISDWGEENAAKTSQTHYDENIYTASKFIQNAIQNLSQICPHYILNQAGFLHIPKCWRFLPNDPIYSKLKTIMKMKFDEMEQFKNDKIVARLLIEVSDKLKLINQFVQTMPITSEFTKKDNTFYYLFNKPTINALLIYCFYSVIYEYILCSDDENLLNADIETIKSSHRSFINETKRDSANLYGLESTDETNTDEIDNLDEVQINIGNILELKERVCKLLVSFIKMEEKNKKTVVFSYGDIMKHIHKSRDREKLRIMDYLGKMSIEEREVENEMKKLKLGKWNVGLQKGLVQYDTVTNERETEDLLYNLMEDLENGNEDVMTNLMLDIYTVQPLHDNEEALDVDGLIGEGLVINDANIQTANDFRGAVNIGELGEDYYDGQYYDEDKEDEFY
jgi:hypothetical protein